MATLKEHPKTKKQEELEKILPKEKKHIVLRDYQKECIEAIEKEPPGSHLLVSMATGLGKTGTFTQIPRKGKMLIVSIGDEIVTNPLAYFDCPVGIEKGIFHAKEDFPDAEVITASSASLCNRLGDYARDEFDLVIIDEAHHSPAKTYRQVIEYFQPRYTIGFTATPKRGDDVRLDDLYDKIVFNRDIRWGIEHGYLSDVYHRVVKIDVDLRNAHVKENAFGESDFITAEINKLMENSAPAIAQVYKDYAFGQTVINVSSRALAYKVADLIPEAVAVTGEMEPGKRAQVLQAFREYKVKTLINVGILKEGVDLPNIQTIIMARPTRSNLLYTQIVGRGLRICEGKEYLNLIDIEGILREGVHVCTAATLMGVDMSTVPPNKTEQLNGTKLSEIDTILDDVMDTPDAWKTNAEAVDLWAKTSGYDVHNVKWFMFPDGHFELAFSDRETKQAFKAHIPAPDQFGRVVFGCYRMPLQIALDKYREMLDANYKKYNKLWDIEEIQKTWGKKDALATENQVKRIRQLLPDYDVSALTKREASDIIGRLFATMENVYQDASEIAPLQDVDTPPKTFLSAETMVIDGETRDVYDFNPGPAYILDAKSSKLENEFTDWLTKAVQRKYQILQGDLKETIRCINASDKVAYGKSFLAYSSGVQYRYLCKIDGVSVSRKDLANWFGKLADILVPKIIAAKIVEPGRFKTVRSATPDMESDPYSDIKFDYPESKSIVAKKKGNLPKTIAIAKRESQEIWAEKQLKKEKRGK